MPVGLYAVGIPIHRQVDSHLDDTRPVAVKKWSCPIFNEQDKIAKSRASVQQADRKKLTASVLMFFSHCNTEFEALAAVVTVVLVKSFGHVSASRIFHVVVKIETSMN